MAGVDSQYVPLLLAGNARRMPKHDAPAVADVRPLPAESAPAAGRVVVVVVVVELVGRVVVVVVVVGVVVVGWQAVTARAAAAPRISRRVRARRVVFASIRVLIGRQPPMFRVRAGR
jgi:hypothetical protein